MTIRIFRSIVLSGSQEQLAADKTKNLNLTIGDTTKKTINRTLAIGAALVATVILTPAAFARDAHHEPANGVQLATDIVNLVRAILEPCPPPVVVETPPTVIEKTVIVETGPVAAREVVTTAPPAVIVTDAGTAIPEYDFILYGDEYIPYYEGWLYCHDLWHWVGAGPRPVAPPRWKPEPRHRDRGRHRVIVPPGHHAPAPTAHREPPRHDPAPVVRREPTRREPVRTVVVRKDRQDAPRREPVKHDGPKKRFFDGF